MGISAKDIHHIRESLKCGSFCKQWWKQLKKQVNRCDLTNFEKLTVFCEIAKGLLIESYDLVESQSDIDFIVNTIKEVINE